MPKFDNKICYDNIISLYKEKGFKIGEFETKIGASIGYFSRLVKDDGKIGTISSEILFNAADALGVSVEILGSEDITNIESTEKYFLDFLNKLCHETQNNSIKWETYRSDDLQAYKNISSLVHKAEGFYDDNTYFYDSLFWDDRKYSTELIDDVYAFERDNGIFMLTHIEVTDDNDNIYNGYELYYKGYDLSYKNKVCYSSPHQSQNLNSSLELLFKNVEDYINRPKIDENVKLVIDRFMKF